MEEAERQQLEQRIKSIRSWTSERTIFSILDTFFQLSFYFDKEKNQSLWEKLRQVLAENEALRDKDTRNFLRDKEYAKKGDWWWDPQKWDKE